MQVGFREGKIAGEFLRYQEVPFSWSQKMMRTPFKMERVGRRQGRELPRGN